MKYNVAIVGATGAVGRKIIETIFFRKFPYKKIDLVASKRSKGKIIEFEDKKFKVEAIEDYNFIGCDFAFFSAGSEVSKVYAPVAEKNNCYVIDNTSFFRMDDDIALIVPEVNADKTFLTKRKIIANPNCSTIQMVVALNNIYNQFGLKRLVISTYQSVSGTGQAAVKQMMDERLGLKAQRVYPYQIDQNCFPHGGDFLENGYTTEEMKLIYETRKIFNDSSIKITATVVRIPVVGGHSESINVETHKPFQIQEIKKTLIDTVGVKVQDNPSKFDYPMPITAHRKNDVFVGRIRKDETVKNGLNLWIVTDNLRKGAATNAVQIADYIFKNNLL